MYMHVQTTDYKHVTTALYSIYGTVDCSTVRSARRVVARASTVRSGGVTVSIRDREGRRLVVHVSHARQPVRLVVALHAWRSSVVDVDDVDLLFSLGHTLHVGRVRRGGGVAKVAWKITCAILLLARALCSQTKNKYKCALALHPAVAVLWLVLFHTDCRRRS